MGEEDQLVSYRVVMIIVITLSDFKIYCGTVNFTENLGRTTIKIIIVREPNARLCK